jgi:hypothetical protein
MTPLEIETKLRGIETWDRATAEQRNCFCAHMAGKQYGHSPVASGLGLVRRRLEDGLFYV